MERTRVLFRNEYAEIFSMFMTDEQLKLLEVLKKNNMLNDYLEFIVDNDNNKNIKKIEL